MLISDIQDETASTSQTTSSGSGSGSISPIRRLSRSTHVRHHQPHRRLFINRTVTATIMTPNRISTLKQRRVRSKLDRTNQAKNSRRYEDATPVAVTRRSRIVNASATYRPSFKVEKLLNDSRGMKKYLIDYDCLFEQPAAKQMDLKPVGLDTDEGVYSNRCSSGYLSDC